MHIEKCPISLADGHLNPRGELSDLKTICFRVVKICKESLNKAGVLTTPLDKWPSNLFLKASNDGSTQNFGKRQSVPLINGLINSLVPDWIPLE